MAQQIIPVPGHDYEVAGDGQIRHNGQALDGVYLDTDGDAWAGKVRNDGHGVWVDIIDADGEFIPARDNWADCIVREIAPIGAPVTSNEPGVGSPALAGSPFDNAEWDTLMAEIAGPALEGALAAREDAHATYENMNLDAYANLTRYSR